MCCYLYTRTKKVTGTSFFYSTSLAVCHIRRSRSHKVFDGQVAFGKNSVGWSYGFKLHLVINEQIELLAFSLTPANVDDRQPVQDLTKNLTGKLFGDRGYISQALFKQRFERRLQLVTKINKTSS